NWFTLDSEQEFGRRENSLESRLNSAFEALIRFTRTVDSQQMLNVCFGCRPPVRVGGEIRQNPACTSVFIFCARGMADKNLPPAGSVARPFGIEGARDRDIADFGLPGSWLEVKLMQRCDWRLHHSFRSGSLIEECHSYGARSRFHGEFTFQVRVGFHRL